MNISVLEVLGPLMVGPSSSHTAGALRLARVARSIYAKPFCAVTFELHGSFAKTGEGHGTRQALLAGVMGLQTTDERIRDAFAVAQQKGIRYTFCEQDLGDVHENTCRLVFEAQDGTTSTVTGSSIGGGRVQITAIDDVPTDFSAESPTLIIRHHDRPGVLSALTALLAREKLNIAIMRTTRESRGDIATTVIETDDALCAPLDDSLRAVPNVVHVTMLNL